MIQTTTVTVGGMSCGACVRHIMRALDGMTGVVHVEVNRHTHTLVVEHRPEHTDAIALAAAIRDAGYTARVRITRTDDDATPSSSRPSAACGCGWCGSSTRPGDWANLGTSTIG